MNELSKINSLLLYFPRIQSIIVDQMNVTEQEQGSTNDQLFRSDCWRIPDKEWTINVKLSSNE